MYNSGLRGCGDGATLNEIGSELGICSQRVQRIQQKAIIRFLISWLIEEGSVPIREADMSQDLIKLIKIIKEEIKQWDLKLK